jgi:hypothetical protein
MKWTKNLWQYLILVVCLAFLGYRLYDKLSNYRFSEDDMFFTTQVKEKGIYNAVSFFYSEQNGRLAAHLLCCWIYALGLKWGWIFYVWTAAITGGLIVILRNAVKHISVAITGISYSRSDLWITGLLFFVLCIVSFETITGEAIFWIAGSIVHTVPVLLVLGGIGFVLKPHKKTGVAANVAMFILFFVAGGFSEATLLTALVSVFVFLIVYFKKDTTLRLRLLVVFLGLVAALLVNMLSPGVEVRLAQLPDFRFWQAVKNTLHAFWLIAVDSGIVGMIILMRFVLNMAVRDVAPFHVWKAYLPWSMVATAMGFMHLFITCWLLSDVAPPRAMLFPALCFIAAIMLVGIRKEEDGNALKLPKLI